MGGGEKRGDGRWEVSMKKTGRGVWEEGRKEVMGGRK